MFPSHVLASGQSPLGTRAIAGAGATGLVALGTNQATALQLSSSMNAITTSSASTGVKLPATEEGLDIWIRNDSGQTITVYPFETSGTTFNNAASNVSLSNHNSMHCKAFNTTYWATITASA